MDKIKNKMAATKLWIEQAEKAYAQEKAVFGDLNLLLAESEIRHLREKRKKISQKFLSKIFFCIIIVLLFCIFKSSFLSNEQVVLQDKKTIVQNSNIDEKFLREKEQEKVKNFSQNEILQTEEKKVAVLNDLTLKTAEKEELKKTALKAEETAIPENVVKDKIVEKNESIVEESSDKETALQELSRMAGKKLRGM